MKRGRPIAPSDISENIPGVVFDAFNELITKNYTNGRARLIQKDVVKLIKENLGDEEQFNYDWLNIEDAYREEGWEVKYDKPAYCEFYDASFCFVKKA